MSNNVPLDRVLAAVRASTDRPIPLPRRSLEEISMETTMTAPSSAGLSPLLDQLDEARAADAVLVDGDWVSPSHEAYARDLLRAWADAAENAGCPSLFVQRMRTHVEVHEGARAAALAAALTPGADTAEAGR